MEALSTAETAECLELTAETVKTRLHRARALLRQDLLARAGTATANAYTFAGARCDRMVARVFARIGLASFARPQEEDAATMAVH